MILNGNNGVLLKDLDDNSVDSVVTDPPYGLKFMNKHWDYDVPTVEFWREVLRVLKPGGHVLSFGGTRTYHRMAVAIEDAGFEIRDQLQWLYGSGFPKSYNVSKGIDKKFGAEREVIGIKVSPDGRDFTKEPLKISGVKSWAKDAGFKDTIEKRLETAPATDLAKQWDGFGTALKPSNEPIVLARKPLSEKNIVDNVLKWGTGALNIDGCRIEAKSEKDLKELRSERPSKTSNANEYSLYSLNHGGLEGLDRSDRSHVIGRWPSNTLFDHAASEMLDEQSGVLKNGGQNESSIKGGGMFLKGDKNSGASLFSGDTGGASRFFYCAKASKSERNKGLDVFHRYEIDCQQWDVANMGVAQLLLKVILESIPNLSTVVSGDHIMVTFPKDSISIIKTKIQQITESKTWNWLTLSLTKGFIQDVPSEARLGTSPAHCVERLSELMKQTGTSLDKGGFLITDAAPVIYQELLKIVEKENYETLNNFHATVKPIKIMQYLVRLITPPNGTCLDPFMGSGSTGIACKNEGFDFIGMELDSEYFEIAKRRIG